MIKKGHLLLLLRKSLGKTQTEVAQECGITVSYLSLLENGHRQPSNSVLFNMAKTYNIPFMLLQWDERDIGKGATPQEQKLIDEMNKLIGSLTALVMQRSFSDTSTL